MNEHRHSQTTAFLAILRRDLYVTWRELPAFLAQVILQPLFLLFILGTHSALRPDSAAECNVTAASKTNNAMGNRHRLS